jgi:hypothetical protein
MQKFEFYMDIVKAVFGVIFGILLGTVILTNGFWGGAIFYAEAVFSAVWFVRLLFDLKKHKDGADGENTKN